MAYLSRATLLIDASKASDIHRLIHSLFGREDKRDFVFSEIAPSHDGKLRFLIASETAPAPSSIFSVETRDYSLDISKGAEIDVAVTAMPVVSGSLNINGKRRQRSVDVVERALARNSKTPLPKPRGGVIQGAAQSWMESQGARHGFTVLPETFLAHSHTILEIERNGGKRFCAPRIECSARVRVEDPIAFKHALIEGVGKGKAWGCGMLKVA